MDPAKCKRYRPRPDVEAISQMRIGPLSETYYLSLFYYLFIFCFLFNFYFSLGLTAVYLISIYVNKL
ncbi:hypothetical protein M6B38_117470 [Iris pallida]|uniref:Uncharacterized protein n=1 Tax=Iris pallida TaxID=29817 RepID=A0AAX6HST6_IRIPA|nr:hypothetical protein M6B38_117470 [Iris pallida]